MTSLGRRAMLFVVTLLPLAGWSTPPAPRVRIAPPPALMFDPDDEVGGTKHAMQDFVTNLETNKQIGKYVAVPVAQVGGGECNLDVAPVIGAHDITRAADVGAPYGHVVSIIKNTHDCKAYHFPLANNKTAVYVANFLNPQVATNQRILVGEARIIILNKAGGGDGHLNANKPAWHLWQCGHEADGRNSDDATIYAVGDLCDQLYRVHHDAHALVAIAREKFRAFTAAMSKNKARATLARRLPQDDFNPSPWFACGGDCCYSDF